MERDECQAKGFKLYFLFSGKSLEVVDHEIGLIVFQIIPHFNLLAKDFSLLPFCQNALESLFP